MVAPKSEFGSRLKELFDHARNGVIAEKLGVAENTVGFYVRGRIPDADMLITISNVTRCNIHWLLTGKGEKHFTPSERESDGVIERVRIVAEEQSRRMHADAEIDGGGGERATLKLLTDYLLATALVEFGIVDSIRDVMPSADIERARRFGFSARSLDERIKQMVSEQMRESESASERVSDAGKNDKIIATITPGKRRTGS